MMPTLTADTESWSTSAPGRTSPFAVAHETASASAT